MSEEFKLTLEPFEDGGKAETVTEIATTEKAAPEAFDESSLTEEERNMVAESVSYTHLDVYKRQNP